MGFPLSIGRAWIKEQAGGWGVEETTFADADSIPTRSFLPDFVQESLPIETFRGNFHSHAVEAGEKVGAELTLVQDALPGWSTATPSGEVTETPNSLLMKSLLGSAASIGYAAAIAGSGQSASSIKYPTTTADSAWAGMAILLAVAAATSGRKFAWAKTVTPGSPDEIVPWINLPGAPTNSSPSYGGRTHWLSTAQPTPFTAQVGLAQSDGNAVYRARDGVCVSGKLDLVGGQLAKAEFGTRFGFWRIAGSWTPAQYAQTYPNTPMLDVANGSVLTYGGSLTTIPSVSIEMTSTVEVVRGFGGFAKFLVTERQVKVTVKHLITDYSQITAPGVEVTTGLQIDGCTVPGRAWGSFMPTYMSEVVSKDEAMGGFPVRTNVFVARIPVAAETAGVNASGSPFRFVMS